MILDVISSLHATAKILVLSMLAEYFYRVLQIIAHAVRRTRMRDAFRGLAVNLALVVIYPPSLEVTLSLFILNGALHTSRHLRPFLKDARDTAG